ncbi:MAG: heme exporter protein CcmB [Gammaproteobacteria bacterium]|nr:heme exporter protein CcmB [Gammaproteobacteria bacterium]
MNIYQQLFLRDLKVSIKRWSDLLTGIIMFILVAFIFPLIAGSDQDFMHRIIGPVILLSSLLASLISMQNIFKPDLNNGSLEQLVLSTHSLSGLVFIKILSYWISSSLPLVVVSSLIASAYYVTVIDIAKVMLTVLLATTTLVNINSLAAALTLGVRYPGALMTLILFPLSLPILIFGSKAIEYSILGMDISGPFYFLTGMMLLSFSLGPIATAFAIRISID